jgi:hypothetical protein
MPTDAEVQGFLGRLKEYRSTLASGDQELLDAMVAAALGKKAAETEDEIKPYWVAYNPPGVGYGNPVGTGYAVGGAYGAVGYNATPWGVAYGARVY